MNKAYIYDIWRLHRYPRTDTEAEIRALCRHAYLGDHTALARVLGRYKMYVDTADVGISSHLLLDGFWEMWVTEAMMRMVPRGTTVLDVGANLGYFTILLADLTGSEGRVLSFEPNPRMASRLRRSVEVNGFSGYTTVYEAGLGDTNGTARMVIDQNQPGGGHILKGSDEQGAVNIPVMRLDEVPGAMDATFMKIDVEGFEHHVWRGMSGILAQKKPLTLFMEFTIQRFEDARGFLHEILAEGFSLNIVDYEQGVRPISEEELFGQPHNIDHMLVFVR
ncbi:FkbM family methyltransferase [Sphingomonas sp. CJ99]